MSKLKVKIKGFAEDAMGAIKAAKARFQKILHASEKDIEPDTVTSLARLLHPGMVEATVTKIEKDGVSASKITLSSDVSFYFQAGTYLTITAKVGDSIVTRPYSICSSPSLGKQGVVEILVKEKEGGFFSTYLNHELAVGDKVHIEVGLGEFAYNPFRDHRHLICIAGGVGIAPFLSMGKYLKEQENPPFHMTVLYGSRKKEDILALKELKALESPTFKVIPVLSEEKDYEGEKGFITKEIIRKYLPDEPVSYFLCGPKAMQDFILKELTSLGVDIRKVRSECPASLAPLKEHAITYPLLVHRGEEIFSLRAREDEPIIVALERAGIYLHTRCRQGHCGACRIDVISGFFRVEGDDYRRHCDKEHGYAYACHSYPSSAMEVRVGISLP